MLVTKYEINGAILEVYDDFYRNLSKEELKEIEKNFLDTAQNILVSNVNKNSRDSSLKQEVL